MTELLYLHDNWGNCWERQSGILLKSPEVARKWALSKDFFPNIKNLVKPYLNIARNIIPEHMENESAGNVFLTVWIKIQSLINGNGRKGFTLLGSESSCANIIAQQDTRFAKTAAWHPARKKKNPEQQWPVIFTQGDSCMARSQLRQAPQTSGQRLVFLLLLMQNRWEELFGCYWRLEHTLCIR